MYPATFTRVGILRNPALAAGWVLCVLLLLPVAQTFAGPILDVPVTLSVGDFFMSPAALNIYASAVTRRGSADSAQWEVLQFHSAQSESVVYIASVTGAVLSAGTTEVPLFMPWRRAWERFRLAEVLGGVTLRADAGPAVGLFLAPESELQESSCIFRAASFVWRLSVVTAVPALPTRPLRSATYVIIPGITGGGWSWKEVDLLLRQVGHEVYRLTLTGLGERVHLSHPDVNLTTHILDVVNVILFEQLQDVVLVAHSSAGIVATGVMDRLPQRIRHVIFLGAILPDHGQSILDCWGVSLSNLTVIDSRVHTSWLPTGDRSLQYPRDVPQPLRTMTEPVTLLNEAAKRLPATIVWLNNPYYTREMLAKIERDALLVGEKRGWTVRRFDSDHVPAISKPLQLASLLQEVLEDQNRTPQES
jgi:pimeloyl-ACP methyl ester carboxylesterase